MKQIFVLLLFVSFSSVIQNARNQTTDIFKKLLGRDTGIRTFSGYQDINWFKIPSQASIYYSLFTSYSDPNFTKSSTPLIIYLSGGSVGTSSQFAAFRQIGPFDIKREGSGFKASENPWAWNKYGHLVFVDQPIGTGFSYNYGSSLNSITIAAKHFVNFLSNLLADNAYKFSGNPLYLAGDGFSCQILPLVKQMISQNSTITFKIQGMILSNPLISIEQQINTYQSFLMATGLFSQNICTKTQNIANQAIKLIRNNEKGSKIKSKVDQLWKGKFYNGMNLYNYKYFIEDTQGASYVEMLNKYKKQFTVPDNLQFKQTNPSLQSAFSQTIFKSYKKQLAAAINDPNIKFLIYSGQNSYITNPASIMQFMKNVPWKGNDQLITTAKQNWIEENSLRGWIRKYQNLIQVTLKDTGYYIYQDQSFSAKSAYLMIGNFIKGKW